jgi:pimeloyl-ACP methyl ester carboxylesterase
MRLRIREALRDTATRPDTFPDDVLDMYEYVISQRGGATAMINYYRAIPRYGWFGPNLDLIRVPTMVIWGMQDFALSPRLLDGLGEWLPDLRVERVPESGHWVPEEQPELVTGHLLRFLSA